MPHALWQRTNSTPVIIVTIGGTGTRQPNGPQLELLPAAWAPGWPFRATWVVRGCHRGMPLVETEIQFTEALPGTAYAAVLVGR